MTRMFFVLKPNRYNFYLSGNKQSSMAEQKSISEAVQKKFLDLTKWANNMIGQLKHNYSTQKVWPGGHPGPYIGYRNTPGAKGSTGDSYRTMYAKVYAGANGDTEKVSFFFNYYLYFVDMGVGAGQPIEDVDNDEKAHWGRLYKRWKEQGDRQSRPILAMELRHQLRRLQTLVSAYYGDFVENGLVVSFDDGMHDDLT